MVCHRFVVFLFRLSGRSLTLRHRPCTVMSRCFIALGRVSLPCQMWHLQVKALMWQLFDGIEYLHDNWVLHRDLKTSNILYNNRGELKVCFALKGIAGAAPRVSRGMPRGSPLLDHTHGFTRPRGEAIAPDASAWHR